MVRHPVALLLLSLRLLLRLRLLLSLRMLLQIEQSVNYLSETVKTELKSILESLTSPLDRWQAIIVCRDQTRFVQNK
jgi:hypothetical protein